MDFETEPEGATVSITGGQTCETPCRLEPPRSRDLRIIVQKDGYTTIKVDNGRRIAWSFWGNLIFGTVGLVGAAVDWATDSMWRWDETKFFWKLRKPEEEVEDEAEEEVDEDKDEDEPEAANGEPDVKREAPTAPTVPVPLPEVTVPAAAKGKNKAPAERPKAEELPKEQPIVDPEAPKPQRSLSDSPALREVQERFPEDYLRDQIRNYYGELKERDQRRVMDSLYLILLEMRAAGEPLDIDEAVRRDQFR